MFALILENKVVDLSEIDFPVASPLQWIECSEEVERDWLYEDGEFKPTDKSSEELLEIAINSKIAEMKSYRDQLNITAITSKQGKTINPQTGELSEGLTNFYFYTKRHDSNPASDPTSVLTAVLVMQSSTPYVTKDLDNNPIIISLDVPLAIALSSELVAVNNYNYKLYSLIETAIKNCETVEDVNAITWNDSYLTPIE
jgi:hypothetical protein